MKVLVQIKDYQFLNNHRKELITVLVGCICTKYQ